MKVSELEGANLDYWVGKAEGLKVDIRRQHYPLLTSHVGEPPEMCWAMSWKVGGSLPYCPSSDWAVGGPLLERERIRAHFDSQGTWHAIHPKESPTPQNPVEEVHPPNRAHGEGSTILIAAMRCFVDSKFGKEVGAVSEPPA